MARQRMVTRTITTNEYDVMVVNMDTLQVETVQVSIPSADAISENELNKKIAHALLDNQKLVQVTATGKTEKLFGMTETDFMKYAKELPPRTATE